MTEEDDIVEVSALTYDQLKKVARKLDCNMEAALEHVLAWWFAKADA